MLWFKQTTLAVLKFVNSNSGRIMTTHTHPNHLPTFNLKAVVRETGLKQDTLRAWERRYGIPQPERTSGGHRVYSQRDIDVLKWLVARQNEGLTISRAVDLWHRLEAEGQNPLNAVATPEPPVVTSTIPEALGHGSNIEAMRSDWIESCLKFDEIRAEQTLAQAAALYSPEIVCTQFLQKGLAYIGQQWFEGKATVQQEHFASTLAVRRLEALIAASSGPTRPGRVLVACPPEELHVFSLLMATFLLRRNGWDTMFLGANVPVSHLEETISVVKPGLVVLAAQQLYTAATLLQTAQVLQTANIPVAFGGQPFNQLPELRNRIPGYFLGEQLDQVSQVVQQALAKTLPVPQTSPIPDSYKKALGHYRDRQPLIESAVWEAIDHTDFPHVTLSYWNFIISRNIVGALTLGSMAYLDEDQTWTRDMLLNHNRSQAALHQYLASYAQAAHSQLNKTAAPVLDWLAQFAGKA